MTGSLCPLQLNILLELGLNGGASLIFSYTDAGMTLTCEPVSILKLMSFPVCNDSKCSVWVLSTVGDCINK